MAFTLAYRNELEEHGLGDIYTRTLDSLLAEDKAVVTIDADLMAAVGTQRLVEKYPGRVLNTGVMEANMVGMAAGLSKAGKKPFVHTFGPFIARRACDQIYISCAYGKNSIRMFGSDPGVTAKYNGGTHMPFEDVAIIRSIPQSIVIDITDAVMMENVMRQVKDMEGVIYFRGSRAPVIGVYGPGSTFEIGTGNVIREGKDVTVIASGIMVAEALQAAELAEREGVSIKIVDMFTIKPLDEQLVIACARETGAIVTAENHNIIGGLGEAVSACLAEHAPTPLERVGVRDEFGEVGPLDYLQNRFALTEQAIVAAVKKVINRK